MSTGHFNFVQFGFQPRVLTLDPAKNSKLDDSSFDSGTFLGGFFVQRSHRPEAAGQTGEAFFVSRMFVRY